MSDLVAEKSVKHFTWLKLEFKVCYQVHASGDSVTCPIAMYEQLTQVSPFLEGRVRGLPGSKTAVGLVAVDTPDV